MRFVLIGLLFAAATANAENWQPIGELEPSGTVLFDVANIAEAKGLRFAWLKAIYPNDRAIPSEYRGSVPDDVRTYGLERTFRQFNCTDRTSAVMRYFWTDVDGKGGGFLYPQRSTLTLRPAQPGTPDELMTIAVCNFAGRLVSEKRAEFHSSGGMEAYVRLRRVVDPENYYPAEAKTRKEEGAPVVQICFDSRGSLSRVPTIRETRYSRSRYGRRQGRSGKLLPHA